MLEGGCHCGFVRYRVTGAPSHETNCHCSICRRTSSAPYLPWFTVARTELVFTAGQPAVYPSSSHGTRRFCPRCGAQITFESSRTPDEIDVTICSLDDPERLPPADHTHAASALSWVALDDLPRHPGARTKA